MQRGSCSVWMAHEQGCPVPLVCSQAEMPRAGSAEAVAWAIYSVEERLGWDKSSFTAYEVLRPGILLPGDGALGDVIYCRMPAPAGMCDRDVVQERFLMRLPGGGGYAVAMRSPSETRAQALGRQPGKGVARATTLLSGYLLQPLPSGGVLLTAMAQTDLGGSIPAWAQALAKKAGLRKLLDWSQLLQDHCRRQAADQATEAPWAVLARLGCSAGSTPAASAAAAAPARSAVAAEAQRLPAKPAVPMHVAAVGLFVAVLVLVSATLSSLTLAEAWG
mmetsp:Transcript_4976/g.15607  ORF Transcript_4976/g.15607 Transcript_4976/m.15607 type:complete len:276 (+) Transcript_4976:153-980(+)